MRATVGKAIPGSGWTYEPKYDGIRVLAFVAPGQVQLMTRNHKDKAKQFPEIADALRDVSKRTRRSYVLDGEIVAMRDGSPLRFQQLQQRMQVQDENSIVMLRDVTPAALYLFDILADGATRLVQEPWTLRYDRLRRRFGDVQSPWLHVTESEPDNGNAMLQHARVRRWEGIMAKRMDSTYDVDERSDDWRKLKIEHRQEFVVGGYTEPRRSRQYFGALLLGYYDGDTLVYAGHAGGGFTHAGLAAMYAKLTQLPRKTSPFHPIPKTNERAHWVRPELVVEVKFNEWTEEGHLRQPIVLGLRDDKEARDVRREPESIMTHSHDQHGTKHNMKHSTKHKDTTRQSATRRTRPKPKIVARSEAKASSRKTRDDDAPSRRRPVTGAVSTQLRAIEDQDGSGMIAIRGTPGLEVSHLGKRFFPKPKKTKGDIMRYYADVAPLILPTIKDRPLVLKRFPEGVGKPSFYQQNAPDDVPDGVRTEVIAPAGEPQRRFIGGDLLTLLYTVQLGAISVDPWHSRVQSLDDADYTILDLDPGSTARFPRVIRVARAVREVLDDFGLHGALKTSGATGLHVYLPLPKGTSNETALLVAQIVATEVATRYPKDATVQRAVRGRSTEKPSPVPTPSAPRHKPQSPHRSPGTS
jgi:bifunctional non-homologous end joining protein LigD